uniref:Alfin N-terminal domain-containing protein n=1 Tax=Tetradesmus obliquus TaxID=3088 RepID=A0A383WNT0_TETOB|eukprot:jgi/Sobl393_1/18810/SZX79118.1
MSEAFPRTPEEIADDYFARRGGILRALTDEVEDFYQACDPEKENLCLYGERNGAWSVELPAEEVPPELPEPCLGVNFARDGMARKDWLALVAVHSDAWLMAVAFFYAVKLDREGRSKLFKQINSLPTLFEVVTGRAKLPPSAKPAGAAGGSKPAGAKRKQDGAMPEGYTGTGSASGSKNPSPGTRQLMPHDVSPMLVGAMAELFWPDDGLWYPVRIERLDPGSRTAKILYLPGLEEEDLDLDDIIRDGHMMLQQPQEPRPF